jgi:hypothetical protein
VNSEEGSRWKRLFLWNLPVLLLGAVTLTAFLSIQSPRTDQISLFQLRLSKLFVASLLLTVLLAFNAVGLLLFLRQRIAGLVLTLFTGASVFFLVEWFLKLQGAH